MKLTGKLLAAACAGLMLSGCGALNNLTGQTDNTVLPGQREDAIPGRSKFPENRDVAASPSSGTNTSAATDETYCAPDDPACKPPGTSGDTFSDPQ